MSKNKKIAIFQKKEIRKTIHNDEWWFVIEDVIFALTDSKNPMGYIKDMRRRDAELAKGWGQIATPPFYRNCRWFSKNKLCKYRGYILKELKQEDYSDY